MNEFCLVFDIEIKRNIEKISNEIRVYESVDDLWVS